MKCPEQVNPQREKAEWWMLGAGCRGRNSEGLLIGYWGFFWGDENILELGRDGGCTF